MEEKIQEKKKFYYLNIVNQNKKQYILEHEINSDLEKTLKKLNYFVDKKKFTITNEKLNLNKCELSNDLLNYIQHNVDEKNIEWKEIKIDYKE